EQVVSQIVGLDALPRTSFYLSGPPESGKSHLLQAACEVVSHHGDTAAYLPLGQLIDSSARCLDGLEALGLVALDGLEIIAGNPEWEEAVFHCFNRLRDRGGALLVAATGAPEALGIQLPDLVSRLQGLLRYRLPPPDDARRRAILIHQAKMRGLELPTASADYLLRHEARALRHLIEMLDRLDAASLEQARRLTVPFIREVLGR
ncbi:MAG: DnaA regulatory inactivator Hda, partial [Gammaproteobacteria bacterium]|nr:DnaA regulatory inactivator Hda [Gammaproteobacteria bacterium]